MAGIYLRYGSYSHAIGECQVAMQGQSVRRDDGAQLEVKWTWSIAGMLQGTSPSDLSAKAAALRTAYSRDGLDVGLFISDGGSITPTSDIILSRNTVRGIKVITPPSFPQGAGAEYATYRTYSIVLEWEFADAVTSLISWSQTVEQQGTGGPDWGYGQIPMVGVPKRQQYSQFSLVSITQSGSAVGNGYYPTPPNPLYAAYELGKMRRVSMRQPNYRSTEREISWSYSFAFAGPM